MDQALTAFLDRDGVICEHYPGDFTRSWRDFRFLPGALEALRLLRQAGIRVAVVSNQSGVGRGFYSAADLDEIDRRMKEAVARSGGLISASSYCPHVEEAGCRCRKPRTGLITEAAARLGGDPGRGWLVGDSETDIIAGSRCGLTTILVLSGATLDRAEAGKWPVRPDHVAADLGGALDFIL